MNLNLSIWEQPTKTLQKQAIVGYAKPWIDCHHVINGILLGSMTSNGGSLNVLEGTSKEEAIQELMEYQQKCSELYDHVI